MKLKQWFRNMLLFRYRGLVQLGLFLTLIIGFWGCASTGMPTGGPKDEEPPYMVKSIPAANSLSFLGDEIRIEFNEIIQVSDIFQKLMVSPPVNKQPAVTTRGKTMIVKFQEDLQPNATYTLDFADAIKDNNEGNVLENFAFSFSTGDYIDSMAISGHLLDASDLSPVANALVMVYSNHADSAFRTLVPLRVTRTNAEGYFSIKNLAPIGYKLYALEDANRNYKYDQPGERIAWYDEIITPYYGFHERIDSVGSDSAVVVQVPAFLPDSLRLFMFQEDNVAPYLTDYKRPARNKADLYFSRPMDVKAEVKVVGREDADLFILENSPRNDSITVWLRDSVLINSDSLLLHLRYQVLDSLKQPEWKNDTINAFFIDYGGSQREGRGRKKDDEQVELPSLRVDGIKPTFGILDRLTLTFPTPLDKADGNAIRLSQELDSTLVPVDIRLVKDSIYIRQYAVDFKREAGSAYVVEIDSAAFTDIYGVSNKPVRQRFTVSAADTYATLYIEVAQPDKSWVLEVLDRQENIVRTSKVPTNGKMGFRYLRPGDYLIRIVEDVNGNGKWDVGDFEKGIQPEKLYYYPEYINARANWDHFINFDPSTFDIYDFVARMRKSQSSRNK